jgi:hypothetical protein
MSAVVRWAPVRWDAFKEMEELGERLTAWWGGGLIAGNQPMRR